MLSNKKTGFIGSGAMGQALIGGILKAGLTEAKNIFAMDSSDECLKYVSEKFKVNTLKTDTEESFAAIKEIDILFLTVKPNVVFKSLKKNAAFISSTTTVVSVAAGVSILDLEERLPNVAVVRVMPNTPAAVGEGMSVLVPGTYAKEQDFLNIKEIFSSVGKVITLDEASLDAVTALSGSGPGYAFVIIDALADAGVKVGLSRQNSIILAAQTLLGAAKMVLETNEHPAVLRDKVTSPGGTTITGIQVLEENGVRGALIEAVEAAYLRCQELGKK